VLLTTKGTKAHKEKLNPLKRFAYLPQWMVGMRAAEGLDSTVSLRMTKKR